MKIPKFTKFSNFFSKSQKTTLGDTPIVKTIRQPLQQTEPSSQFMSMLKAEGMKSQIEQDNDKKQQALEQRFEKFKNPLGLSLAERLARLNERYSKL
jgi:hypothetical protein